MDFLFGNLSTAAASAVFLHNSPNPTARHSFLDHNPIMSNEVLLDWPSLPPWLHTFVGVYIMAAGSTGCLALSRFLLGISRRRGLSRRPSSSVSPTDLLILNLVLANLLVCVGQAPFSATSSLYHRWLFGAGGCQLYAFFGFLVGMASILAVCGLIRERHQLVVNGKKPLKERYRDAWSMIVLQWLTAGAFSLPPAYGVMGRYFYEPSGTMCTLDYWHGDFRNYHVYISLLTIFGFIIPIGYACYQFLSTVNELRYYLGNTRSEMDKMALQDHLNMSKFCGCLLLCVVLCWWPYALLCLWPMAFGVHAINVHLTVLPPLAAKTCPLAVGILAAKLDLA